MANQKKNQSCKRPSAGRSIVILPVHFSHTHRAKDIGYSYTWWCSQFAAWEVCKDPAIPLCRRCFDLHEPALRRGHNTFQYLEVVRKCKWPKAQPRKMYSCHIKCSRLNLDWVLEFFCRSMGNLPDKVPGAAPHFGLAETSACPEYHWQTQGWS